MNTRSRPYNRRKRERGSSLIEYTLAIALISIIAIGGVRSLGTQIRNSFFTSQFAISGAGGVCAGANC